MGTDGRGDRAERREVERGFGPRNHTRRLTDRVDATAQSRGHDLLEFREGGERGLFDAEPPGGGHPQPDGDRDRLVVVEQQRRHRGSGGQAVSARDAGARIHRITERAELADVGAHGPRAHTQSVGECGTRPVASELKQ